MSNRNGVWSLPAQYQAIADQDWTMAPGAPTGVSATAGNAQAEVSFTAPTFAGIPGTITQFKVTSSSGQTATGSASPITVTGLTNGSGVTFTAQAQNAIGLGKASAASSSVTPLAEVISSLFSTHLYTGTGSNQTITNGVNLSGKGGMVWIKGRNATSDHALVDTVRGGSNSIASNTTAAQRTDGAYGVTFNSNGFTSTGGNLNVNGREQVSWTFRKEPKFFDIVTWTGNGTEDRTISHNLGSVPGMIIVKGYSLVEDWNVYHRGIGNAKYLQLNSTAAAANVGTGAGGADLWMSTDPTSTTFKIDEHDRVNKNGETYVAYLFAHNDGDGGFGPDSEDIIKCGSYTTDSNEDATINLGFEPQFVLAKRTDSSTGGTWMLFDSMRGMQVSFQGQAALLEANDSNAEANVDRIALTHTGFKVDNYGSNRSYIYMAIRRPDQSTPTAASDVFQAHTYTGDGSTRKYNLSITPDMVINMSRTVVGDANAVNDRLRGSGREMYTDQDGQEYNASTAGMQFDYTNAIEVQNYRDTSSKNYLNLCWKRAPGYFDMVAYSGTGSNTTVSHNLGAVPEMMWVKGRDVTDHWHIYHKDSTADNYLILNGNLANVDSVTIWNDTTPTSSVFTVGTNGGVNGSSSNYIAYLFATVAGVSKVGSYTGNDVDQTIDCGFSNGARFILIKRTDSTGDWYVLDSERGLTTGSDPYLKLNTTDAEATGNMINVRSSGFGVSAGAGTNGNSTININSATYIFYAIAA